MRRNGCESLGHLRHRRCAIITIRDRLRMIHDGGGVILLRNFERFGIRDGRFLTPGMVKHNSFESLRAHHRAKSAACGNTRGNSILVKILDPRRLHAHLAAGTDQGNRNFIAVFFEQLRGSGIHTESGKTIRFFPLRATERKMQNPIAFLLRHVFDNERMDAHECHVIACASARVGFLDAACQRGLATHREPVRGRKHVPD